MSKENILRLRAELVPKQQSQEQSLCHHPKIIIDEEVRLLFCEKCSLWIEPFDYLMGWAVRDWAAEQRFKHYDEQLRKIADRIPELKRQERNIKARLRRLQKKAKQVEQ